MNKEIEEAYVAGWQDALEDIMTTVEDSVRSMVENFVVPDEYAEPNSKRKLFVPEEKKIITP